jgi:hypothetical protein
MSYAFAGATSFDKMLFWNTSQVTTMQGMFYGASSFNGDINVFDVSNVVDLSEMVRYTVTVETRVKFDCKNSNNCSKTFSFVFQFFDAISFNGDIATWRPKSALTMSSMFAGTESFMGTMGDLSDWDTSSVRDLSKIFERSSYRGSLANWKTSQVTDFSYMFQESEFSGNISAWDVSRGTDFSFACTFAFLFCLFLFALVSCLTLFLRSLYSF